MMKSNLLMVADVLGLLLDPQHAAWVRSAGWVGADAFQEAVERGLVPIVVRGTKFDPLNLLVHLEQQCPPIDANDNNDDVNNTIPSSLFLPVGDLQQNTSLDVALKLPKIVVDEMVMSIDALTIKWRVPSRANYSLLEVNHLRILRCNNPYLSKIALHQTNAKTITFSQPSKHSPFYPSSTRQLQQYGTGKTGEVGEALIDGLLMFNYALDEVDLSGFYTISKIGMNFMANCQKITHVDLSAFRGNLTMIGETFMSRCRSLEQLDMSPLHNLTVISNRFLEGCSGLESLDLSPFTNVRSINDSFLEGCTKLTELDFTPMKSISIIRDDFLKSCTGLRKVNLQSFIHLKTISNRFLSGCSNLTEIDISSLGSVTCIESGFLSHCSGLVGIDLSSLSKVVLLDSGFLEGCSRLEKIDLNPLQQVSTLGGCRFMSKCTHLVKIDISAFNNITALPMGFVNDFSNKVVVLPTALLYVSYSD